MPERPRLAWARLNAYGIILAGLMVLALRDLIHPADADLARLVGDVPPGQNVWTIGFAVAGSLLLLGFALTDRLAETAGLVIMVVCVVVQSLVAYDLLGWTDYTQTRLAIIALLGLGSWARISVLWTREGITVTIPARGRR